MDILINHWRPLPRQTPSRFRLVSMGAQRKSASHQIRNTFATLNFSFILKGGGAYRRGNEQWKVEAPAILMQWPGEAVEYGPNHRHGFWQEFYLIYDPTQAPDFIAAGLLRPGEVCRTMGNPEQVEKRIQEIVALSREKWVPGLADRIDILCELLILESLKEGEGTETHPDEKAVQAVHRTLIRHLDKEMDLQTLVREHGISYSSFRRVWNRLYSLPPRRYLIQRRIEKACELLVGSSLSIGEIATGVGFSDPLYFSRSFRRETGMNASAYRQLYQTPSHHSVLADN